VAAIVVTQEVRWNNFRIIAEYYGFQRKFKKNVNARTDVTSPPIQRPLLYPPIRYSIFRSAQGLHGGTGTFIIPVLFYFSLLTKRFLQGKKVLLKKS